MRPTRLIKRYLNRKLYDTVDSAYVKLEEIAKFLQNGDDIIVVDNATKRDITKSTLIQLITENERSNEETASLGLLKEIARNSNGSFSSFIHSLGYHAKPENESLLGVPGQQAPGLDNSRGISATQ